MALAFGLLTLMLIRTPLAHPRPSGPADIGLSGLYLTGGRSSLHLLSGGDGQRGGEGWRRGEESVWLVSFNAEADVCPRTCEIIGLEMCHDMIIRGSVCRTIVGWRRFVVKPILLLFNALSS